MTKSETGLSLSQVAPSLANLRGFGEVFAASGLFADTRQAAQAIVKMQAGAEMGFGPFASMTGVSIIQGKACIGAHLMAAAVMRTGRYTYRVLSHTNEGCKIEFRMGAEVLGVSEFNKADATAAGLVGKDNWKRWPRNMYFARAMSNGVRWYCPDALGGPLVYTPEELGAEIDEEGNALPDRKPVASVATEPVPTPPVTVVNPVPEIVPKPVGKPLPGATGTNKAVIVDAKEVQKSKADAKRAWTRYEITTGTGKVLSTFSASVYERCAGVMGTGTMVALTWKANDKGGLEVTAADLPEAAKVPITDESATLSEADVIDTFTESLAYEGEENQ